MQNALNNPHYKKIWERVIMNRHPEAKSFEDALKLQTGYIDCVYNVNYYGQEIECVISSTFDFYLDSNKMLKHSVDHSDMDDEILGRPINLEDVIGILSHQLWKNRGWIESFMITETVNRGEYHINVYDKDYTSVGLCFWRLTKPLHEQTLETWGKITELI